MKEYNIIKLTLKQRVDILKDSCPELEVNEEVKIPKDGYGLVFIRKSLAVKGLNSAQSVFHAGWEGNPTLVVQNFGVSDVELRKDDEVAELWVFGGDV